jgi:hypothetical protein
MLRLIPFSFVMTDLVPRLLPGNALTRGSRLVCLLLAATTSWAFAEDLSIVRGVEAQPLKAQAKRVAEALDSLGEPLSKEQAAALDKAIAISDPDDAVEAIQKVLDPRCLVGVNINPESRVKVARGPAAAQLVEQGWRVFLVKVHNEGGVTAELKATSPNAAAMHTRSTGSPDPRPTVKPEDVPNRWMDIQMFNSQPLVAKLSGLELEYRIVQIYSRDHGKREATIGFSVGQGTQDIGFRNEVAILFECEPAVHVKLSVLDDDGTPTTAQFVFRDAKGRIYPAQSRRLAPDLFFHAQIYRADGEEVLLPPGQYEVTYNRGPEYVYLKKSIAVPTQARSASEGSVRESRESFRLKRWIKLSDLGWYSGDHHVHAAGCAHYEAPTEGVTPADMMRHILGEDLNVGCVLSWGPCWYYQKQFFEGAVHKLSKKDYLMRYDVEVSGFPSQHAGHLCLLRLKEDDYEYPQPVEFDWKFQGKEGHFKGTKTEQIGEWPTWDLPILKWGKEQGGVVGFSHSGWGLELPDYGAGGQRVPVRQGKAADKLPDYAMPPFNGIGANEFVVDTVHGVCDFISSVDTPAVWELNAWYHTLNCGMTTRISGETDFPCIYGDKVGLGRIYVKLDKAATTSGGLDFDKWVAGIRDGRSYVTDGLSHLVDFTANGFGIGEKGDQERSSFLAAKAGQKLTLKVNAAAYLTEEPEKYNGQPIKQLRLDVKPYWHLERARIDSSRKVPVELIVNGYPVETKEIAADGKVNELTFDYTPKMSSWIAVRIFPSSHTNPIFVEVDGKPIRASKRSAQWCREAIDVCWNQKVKLTRDSEKQAAQAAYDVARQAYDKVLQEAFDDRQGAQ